MPCFYCGKPISLVRRLADPDFCSEDHRQKYHELTRMALNRLVETRDHLEAAGPKRKRLRAGRAMGPPLEPAPPLAELLEERMAAVPVTGRVALPGQFVTLTHTHPARLPVSPSPRCRPVPLASQRITAGAPGPLQTAEPPHVATSGQGAFLPIAVPTAPSEPGLDWCALVQRPSFSVQPIRTPRALEAGAGQVRVPVRADAAPGVCAFRFPSLLFVAGRLAPPPRELRSIATAPATAAAGAALADTPVSMPVLGVPRTPAAGLRGGLGTAEVWSQGPLAAPAGARALPPPLPATVSESRSVRAVAWDVTFHPALAWRLQPSAFGPRSITAPPVLGDLLAISAPHAPTSAGQAMPGPAPGWRPQAVSVPWMGCPARAALPGAAPAVPAPLPPSLASPGPGAVRPAHLPESSVPWKFSMGGVRVKLRGALGSGQPLPLGSGPSHAAPPQLRASTLPGYRIAAWAFTHAAGLRRPAAPPERPLLTAEPPGPTAPAGRGTVAAAGLPALGLSPVLPAWRAGLAGEWLPAAPIEPPPPAEASRLTVEPVAAPASRLWQCPLDVPSPRFGVPEGLRLPVPPLVTAPVLAAASLPAVAQAPPPAQAPAAWSARAPGWEALGASSIGLEAIHSSLLPVVWTAAANWLAESLETTAPSSGCARAEAVALGQCPTVRTPTTGMAAHGPFGGAAPRPLPEPSEQDSAAACFLRTDTAAPLQLLTSTAFPGGLFALTEARLSQAPLAARGVGSQDVPMAWGMPSRMPPGLSGPAVPSSRGISECVADLSWPHSFSAGPLPCNLESVPLRQPRQVRIERAVLLPARAGSPVPHRFERFLLQPRKAPGWRLGWLWKRIPRKLVAPLAVVLLVIILAAVAWNPVRESIRQRAAVVVEEDFASGMQGWTAGGADWTRDPAGFMQIGSLALLARSLSMADYRLEFMGEVERQSLAWVFRAQDSDNFYVMKIAVLQPGPLPTLAIMRSRVLLGQETPLGQVPLRVFLHNAPFRVLMRVSGNDFTTFVNNQQVDFWQDDRLRTGGAGFFCEKGGRARLYWVKIANQDDLVGRLCSYLAPNTLSNDGSRR